MGRDALLAVQAEGGPKRKLVGLEMIERGIGRDGYPVFSLDGKRLGEITSGSPSPFLKKNIALAYVPVEYTALDTEVNVEIRGQMVKAKVVPTPFYKRLKVAHICLESDAVFGSDATTYRYISPVMDA